MMKPIEGQRGVGGLLLFVFIAGLIDAISISYQVANHVLAVSCSCRIRNVAGSNRFFCNAGGSSSLHTRMKVAARLMRPLRCAATHLKSSHRLLQQASNTQRAQTVAGKAQRTAQHARALQPHLHFPRATPRHTLHHQLSPAPRTVRHAYIGRRGGQSTARERHTAENVAHSTARTILRENGAEGRRRCLPTVQSLRKQPCLGLDELEREHDLRAKLRRRPQLAVGDEGKRHGCASEVISE
jgi:hypothetical protein